MRYDLLLCGFRLWILGIWIDALRICLNAVASVCLRMRKPLSSKGVVRLSRRLEAKASTFEDEEKRFLALKNRITNERDG